MKVVISSWITTIVIISITKNSLKMEDNRRLRITIMIACLVIKIKTQI